MNTAIQIPEEVARDRQEVMEMAKALQIIDQRSYEDAATSLAWAGELEKKITAHYEPFRLSTKAAYDAVLDAKKADLDSILEVKRILSKKTAEYDLAEENKRREIQRKQDAEAARVAAEKRDLEIKNAKAMGASREEIKEMKAAPITFVSPTVDPTHARSKFLSKPIERWKAEVLGDDGLLLLVRAVAAGKAPLRLILPNETALNGLARTLKDTMNIPGVKAVCEYTSTVKGGV